MEVTSELDVGQHVKTVGGHVVGEVVSDHGRERGEDVRGIRQLMRNLPCTNPARPAGDEWHAVAAFIAVSF